MKTETYRVSPFPHWRDSGNVPKFFWSRNAALAPLLIAYALFFHIQALRILGVSLAAAFAAEGLAALAFKRKAGFQNGEVIGAALVFSLLLPPQTPAALIAGALFLGIFFGREIFGGLGSSFLNTALLAHALLQLAYPEIFYRGGVLSIHTPLGAWAVSGTLVAGAALLFVRKSISWQAAGIYFGMIVILEKLIPLPHEVALRRLFFAAFFLLTDPAGLPVTPRARLYAAAIAGAMTHFLRAFSSVGFPEVFAVLSLSLLAPWLDQWILPAGAAKTKEMARL